MTEKRIRKETGDCYYRTKHASGLEIYVYPMEGFHTSYAVFGTAYGSVDTKFRRFDSPGIVTMPSGIAHFLEHKLFEDEDGDAFLKFSRLGADANAYTSFSSTCYLFSCTQDVYECLSLLLRFVRAPYFTEENVKKEQGIIRQEIKMDDDDPNWSVLVNLFDAMYFTRKERLQITGTAESIKKITPKYLYDCYGTFYNLNNMILSVAGNVDPEKVLELCDRILTPSEKVPFERIFENEPESVRKRKTTQSLSVSVPIFGLGFKETRNRLRTEKEAAGLDILLELLASDASPLFRRLLDAQLINESTFSYETIENEGCNAVIFSGESRDPDAVAKEINAEIDRFKREGIDPASFERARRTLYGRYIASMNSAENLANSMLFSAFSKREFFSSIDAAANAEPADVIEQLSLFQEPNSSLSVILPR